jgi:hypothetical protein
MEHVSVVGSRTPAGYPGFAGPLWSLDENYLGSIVSIYYREYLRLFLEQYGANLEYSSSGLVALIQQAAEDLSAFDIAWNWSCAAVREAVVNRVSDDNALHSAICLGNHLLSSGFEGEFRASSPHAFSALWQNYLIARSAKSIHARRSGDRAKIVADATSVTLRLDSHGWMASEQSALPTAQSQHIKLTLLTPEVACHIGCEQPPELSLPDLRLALEKYQGAAHLLERHAPDFARWVGRVITFISPIDAPVGVMRSGSGRQWPAVAEISFRCDDVAIAEMLVHEATHQYYNILLMVEPVTDGSDRRLYYSPVRKCERPIEMILLAYHAFANVLLYYRACQSSGLQDNGFCSRNEQELLPDLRELQRALESTQSLTEVGESLWRPLRPHVAQPA